nr:carcinoembryonic antigen-related cell adhesion molecule 3-like isoform X1 [Pogona vitticeps]
MPKSRTPSKEACPAYGPYLGYKGPSWPVFLLTGCILSSSCFWLIQAETNIPIKSEPWIPLRESEVTLIPGGVLKNVSACFWYRGDRTNESLIVVYELSPTSQIHYGQAYTKRETIKPNCHLHIANLTAKDNAFFIVHKKSEAAESEVGRVFLLVGEKESEEDELSLKKVDLSDFALLGIVVGCIIGIAFLIGVVGYEASSGSSPQTARANAPAGASSGPDAKSKPAAKGAPKAKGGK